MAKKISQQEQLQAAYGFGETPGQVHVLSPEGVPIQATRVSPSNRLGALAIDTLIQVTILICGSLALLFSTGSWEMFGLLFNLMWLFMRIPYYLLQEYYLRGQTLGKKAVGIRVVDEAGGRLRLSSLIVRNVSREIEVFVPLMVLLGAEGLAAEGWWVSIPLFVWTGFVLIVPFMNPDRKRLGDLLAGTVVVSIEKPTLLRDIATRKITSDFTFTTKQLAGYGEFEVQVLQRILDQNTLPDKLTPIAVTIAKKIGYRGRIAKGRERDFLNAFYLAQRKYLEEGMLVGKRKSNKLEEVKSL